MNRRTFIGQAGGMVASLGAMSQMARATGTTSNKKVLVCIYLFGGNDCWNLVGPIPTAGLAKGGYNLFRTTGSSLSRNIFSTLPSATNANSSSLSTFGMGLDPAVATALASLPPGVQTAILGGVGPMAAKPELNAAAPSAFPPRVASHEDQTEQWQAAMKQPFDFGTPRTGFEGRLMQHIYSQSSASPTDFGCVSFFNANTMQNCGNRIPPISPFILSSGGGVLPGNVIKAAGSVNTPDGPTGQDIDNAVSEIMSGRRVNRHSDLLAERYLKARRLYGSSGIETVAAAAAVAHADTVLKKQLFQVAAMIKNPLTQSGVNRQTFFVGMGGFDTHGGDNAALLQTVAEAIAAFFKELFGSEVSQDQVTLFTASEFGRSLLPNGYGTDHAWGGHHLIVGNAVRPGFYGVYPQNILSHLGRTSAVLDNINDDIKEGFWTRTSAGMVYSPEDYRAIYSGTGKSGWLQPHVSTDEYYGELAAWFLDKPDLVKDQEPTSKAIRDLILPNLSSLENQSNSTQKLGFLLKP